MPKYTANPSKDSALGVALLPVGIYEAKITRATSFLNKWKDGDKAGEDKNWGVRFSLKVAEGEFLDKSIVPLNLWYHSQGGADMAKTHLMAINGFTDEKLFNEWAEGKDWGYDPETGGVGDAFSELKGKRIKVQLDQQTIEGTDKVQNNIKNVFPV